ncbi:hypothetical protein CAOG_04645 [Capsaspora owczarzaki ATCC 30864]|uniref:hypothetical protein n=1 Tax=Capsaspora owczarzaki (strain ATCC 30864) TaxID=595528 RepID=UPI00035219D3|nr:hypothetical protein CAOG_04645 [Capsaspora owczarzaki ATCC 30864]|eukprot:XP_004347392.2 hypothetical protein CAOG_04645 [Capsaspora owczarzaki ATCC 30864]
MPSSLSAWLHSHPFPPLIHKQLETLGLHTPINHLAPFRLESALSSGAVPGVNDRIQVLVPYCNQTLRWEILFNALDPAAPPDFVFMGAPQFAPSLQQIPNLLNWNINEPQALFLVLCELSLRGCSAAVPKQSFRSLIALQIVMSAKSAAASSSSSGGGSSGSSSSSTTGPGAGGHGHGSSLPVKKASAVSTDAEALTALAATEVIIGADGHSIFPAQRYGQQLRVALQFALHIDLSKLPNLPTPLDARRTASKPSTGTHTPQTLNSPSVEQGNVPPAFPGKEHIADTAAAAAGPARSTSVSPQPLKNSTATCRVTISFTFPEARTVLPADIAVATNITIPNELLPGVFANAQLPRYTLPTLADDFLGAMHSAVSAHIETYVERVNRRSAYVSAFWTEYRSSILEFSVADGASMISFHLALKNHYAVALLEISPRFPQEAPVLTLTCAFFDNGDQPFRKQFRDYPYSPRWSPEEMAQRMRVYLDTELPRFLEEAKSAGGVQTNV